MFGLLFTFIFFSAIVFGQKTDSILFKGTAKIIVKNNLSASDNFKEVGKALIDLGYMIGEKDSEFNQILSDVITVTDYDNHVKYGQIIYVTTKDNQIILTTRARNTSTFKAATFIETKKNFEPTIYNRNKDAKSVLSFRNLEKLAKVLPSQEIIYSE